MGTFFRAAVVEMVDDPLLGRRSPQVKNTVIFAPVDTLDETHYLCALLNSAPLNYCRGQAPVACSREVDVGDRSH